MPYKIISFFCIHNTISTLYLRSNTNMRRYLLYFLLFCNFIFFESCKKDKFKAPKASFLVVNNVTLKTITTGPNQGENSHKITDMWYYVDGEFKGVFPIGSVMPIVSSGNAEITLFAGIKNNGISSTRLPYPVYVSKTYNLDIEAGKTYTLSPEFEYNSSAFFYYADGFNTASGGGSYFTSSGNSNCVFSSDPTKAYGGYGGSIIMTMSDALPTATLLQYNSYYLPDGGSVIYVELDFKCNQSFNIGVIGYSTGGGSDKRNVLTINPSEEWNHIYVQLTKTVSTPPTYGAYRVFIEANKSTTSPEIYIDNVKLIYL